MYRKLDLRGFCVDWTEETGGFIWTGDWMSGRMVYICHAERCGMGVNTSAGGMMEG